MEESRQFMTRHHVLVRITAFDPRTEQNAVLRVATAAFRDGLETEEDYQGLVLPRTSITISQDLGIFGTPLGTASAGTVSVTFANDGRFDVALRNYAFDGRKFEIFAGSEGQTFQEHVKVFTGVVSDGGMDWKDGEITIAAVDVIGRLAGREVQDNTFAGTGGTEGGEALAGTLKPITVGKVMNAPAVFVDSSREIFQIADPAFTTADVEAVVSGVWVKGVAIEIQGDSTDLINANVTAGKCMTDKSRGLIKFGSNASGGDVTCDLTVQEVTGGSSSAAACVKVIALAAGLTEADLDMASFAALDLEDASETGGYSDSGGDALNMIDELLASVIAYRTVNGLGQLAVARFTPPTATSAEEAGIALSDRDIAENSFDAETLGVPASDVRMAYDRNYLVQRRDSLDTAGDLDVERSEFAATEFRYASQATGAAGTWPTSQVMTVETGLIGTAAATAKALVLADVFGKRRDLIRFSAPVAPGVIGLGKEVWLTHDRFHPNGKAFRVTALEQDVGQHTAEMELLG